jgi:hypothetical protein
MPKVVNAMDASQTAYKSVFLLLSSSKEDGMLTSQTPLRKSVAFPCAMVMVRGSTQQQSQLCLFCSAPLSSVQTECSSASSPCLIGRIKDDAISTRAWPSRLGENPSKNIIARRLLSRLDVRCLSLPRVMEIRLPQRRCNAVIENEKKAE